MGEVKRGSGWVQWEGCGDIDGDKGKKVRRGLRMRRGQCQQAKRCDWPLSDARPRAVCILRRDTLGLLEHVSAREGDL